MSEHTLLIVDDDVEILDDFRIWFSRRGFHVTTVQHPSLALATAAYNRFSAAIVDITLPEMNGLELIDKLRCISSFPIIVISGNDDPRLANAVIKHGAFRMLIKPVSMREIEEVIRASIQVAPILHSA